VSNELEDIVESLETDTQLLMELGRFIQAPSVMILKLQEAGQQEYDSINTQPVNDEDDLGMRRPPLASCTTDGQQRTNLALTDASATHSHSVPAPSSCAFEKSTYYKVIRFFFETGYHDGLDSWQKNEAIVESSDALFKVPYEIGYEEGSRSRSDVAKGDAVAAQGQAFELRRKSGATGPEAPTVVPFDSVVSAEQLLALKNSRQRGLESSNLAANPATKEQRGRIAAVRHAARLANSQGSRRSRRIAARAGMRRAT
jgi:hypothetical protein